MTIKPITLATSAILALVIPFITQAANPPKDVASLIAKEREFNDKCRGGSGDNPATWKACEERDNLIPIIKSKGWCYGKKGQAGYQMEWHECASQSIK